MRTRWQDKSKTAKLVTIFASILILSIGLCAGNLALFSHYGAISAGEPVPPRSADTSTVLIGTGFLELAGMALGGLGLIVIGITALIRRIAKSAE